MKLKTDNTLLYVVSLAIVGMNDLEVWAKLIIALIVVVKFGIEMYDRFKKIKTFNC